MTGEADSTKADGDKSGVAPESREAPPGDSIRQDNDHASGRHTCTVFATRDEVTLQFDISVSPSEGKAGPGSVPDGRIVLAPFAAKRLAMMLEKGLDEYEKRFGEIVR